MTAMVELDGIGKRYGAVEALHDVTLRVEPGEILALVGHNGAGKTTLMKLMLGLITPSAGRARIGGQDPAGRGGASARRQVGFLPESVAFPATMSGREIIAFYSRLKDAPVAAAEQLLQKVGLADAADRRIGTYSKGMRQRLGLAQAMIGQPGLLLLDEPTTGLDPALRREFYAMLAELRDSGVAIVLSSHALAEIEDKADRFALIGRGRLLACDDIAGLHLQAALPLRLRILVPPCNTGRVIDALDGLVETEARSAERLAMTCRPDRKIEILQRLASLGDVVRDIEFERPGLEAIYHMLSERQREQRT